MAISRGTPTSFMLRFGSGDMTVLALKFTLLPERLPRNRPSFPFSLWERVLRGRPLLWRAGGTPETVLSRKVVMWYWRSSQRSSMISWGAPASRFSWNRWLILMMSTSLWVRSSSLLWPLSRVIDGLIVTGGTGRTVRSIHSGLAVSGFIPITLMSSSGIFSNRSLMSEGVSLCPSST